MQVVLHAVPVPLPRKGRMMSQRLNPVRLAIVDPPTSQPGASERHSSPHLDPDATAAADMTFLVSRGALADKLRDALTAYLFVLAYPDATDVEIAFVVARARRERRG